MKLYEIKEEYLKAINSIVFDEETGEIINADALDKINSDFDEKVENVACEIKNLIAFENELKEQKKSFDRRIKSVDSQIEWLKGYLDRNMKEVGKDKLTTVNAEVSFRKSTSVEVADEFIDWALNVAKRKDLLTEKTEYKPDKKAIKEALKNDEEIEFAEVKENKNIQIK